MASLPLVKETIHFRISGAKVINMDNPAVISASNVSKAIPNPSITVFNPAKFSKALPAVSFILLPIELNNDVFRFSLSLLAVSIDFYVNRIFFNIVCNVKIFKYMNKMPNGII